MQNKPKYNWKITAKKFAKSVAYVIIAGLGVAYGQSAWYLALVPLFQALENWLKYRG